MPKGKALQLTSLGAVLEEGRLYFCRVVLISASVPMAVKESREKVVPPQPFLMGCGDKSGAPAGCGAMELCSPPLVTC